MITDPILLGLAGRLILLDVMRSVHPRERWITPSISKIERSTHPLTDLIGGPVGDAGAAFKHFDGDEAERVSAATQKLIIVVIYSLTAINYNCTTRAFVPYTRTSCSASQMVLHEGVRQGAKP